MNYTLKPIIYPNYIFKNGSKNIVIKINNNYQYLSLIKMSNIRPTLQIVYNKSAV